MTFEQGQVIIDLLTDLRAVLSFIAGVCFAGVMALGLGLLFPKG
ncbi:hypothetical protein OKA05_02970 [Luteolibacter arcticus]|uniref:Uncharacterized protein n=1 Tax=Luteolibacter arcticus TaxID=1581411 RepID=A0ABT3GDZ8_9BACT|nr:hypothetical protein [Luteolibacter arcticus]MCW1921498.1 hypothetical protein [Luteolibacter arcticus]